MKFLRALESRLNEYWKVWLRAPHRLPKYLEYIHCGDLAIYPEPFESEKGEKGGRGWRANSRPLPLLFETTTSDLLRLDHTSHGGLLLFSLAGLFNGLSRFRPLDPFAADNYRITRRGERICWIIWRLGTQNLSGSFWRTRAVGLVDLLLVRI